MTRKALLGHLADVDLRLLRIFRAVADAGGISAAELELNIGRSTISRHVKALETRLGVTLCRRGRAGFRLTDEGRRIYDAILRLLGALDEFRYAVSEVHERMTGNLVIALFDKTATNPDCRVWSAIRAFDDIAPAVTVDVHVEPVNNIESGVIDGRFHIGLIPEHRPSSSLHYDRLYSERMYLYCGAAHPLVAVNDAEVTDKAIRDCKYAGLGYHSPNMEISRRLRLKRKANGYDLEAIVTLILSGRYIGYMPEHYARSFVEDGLIRPVGHNKFFYDCGFSSIVRGSPEPSLMVATFRDLLRRAHGRVCEHRPAGA